jgi:hypothetical protein
MYEFATFYLPDESGIWKEVPKVFATPDRAFAKWVQLHPTRPDGSKRDKDDVTLPMVSMAPLTDPELDMARYSMVRNRVAFTNDFNGIFIAPHSDPYTFRYQLDLWAKRRRHMNLLVEQYLRAFNGDITVIQVPLYEEGSEYRQLGAAIPTMICEVYQEGIVDNSDLEAGEEHNRVLRKSITVRMDGWLVKGVELKSTVRRVHVSFKDASMGNEIDKAEFNEDTLVVTGL